jgi:TonB family protein
MDAHTTWAPGPDPEGRRDSDAPTANDRFKGASGSRFWGSLILATAFHVGVFSFWPELTAQDFSFNARELEAIELPPEVEIPPAPKAISRPAQPVLASAEIDTDITMGLTTLDAYEPEDLPPPVGRTETRAISSAPTFTPMTVRPGMKNRTEVLQALEREYPSLLRDAGIGGTVLVWFFIDETGTVQQTRLHTSSGHRSLDDAALKVAGVIRFTPALNRDKRVPVWISLPVTFVTR